MNDTQKAQELLLSRLENRFKNELVIAAQTLKTADDLFDAFRMIRNDLRALHREVMQFIDREVATPPKVQSKWLPVVKEYIQCNEVKVIKPAAFKLWYEMTYEGKMVNPSMILTRLQDHGYLLKVNGGGYRVIVAAIA